MGKNVFIVVVFVFMLVSNTCSADIVLNLRKLIANEPNNASTNSSVSPTGSPTDQLNKESQSLGEPGEAQHKDSHKGNQNDNKTLPFDSKDETQNPSDRKPSTGKNNVDKGNEKAANQTAVKSNDDSCEGSLHSCRDQEMLACVKASKSGSPALFLVVLNGRKSDIKVYVHLPNSLEKPLLTLKVPKQNATRTNMPLTVDRKTTLYVSSGKAKCVLGPGNPISVANLIQQLTFYSKQVNPIYAVYGSFLMVLLFGGTWVCCRLRKRNRGDGIPYQELEMGLPESTASAVNMDAAEGWDHDWDDDDWDEETAVKSPAGPQARNISVDGLTSRSAKKDGWENDWEG